MSRRGSVKKDGSGRWMFVIDSRPPGSGTRRQIKRRGFRTKAEAVDANKKKLVEQDPFVSLDQRVSGLVSDDAAAYLWHPICARKYRANHNTIDLQER